MHHPLITTSNTQLNMTELALLKWYSFRLFCQLRYIHKKNVKASAPLQTKTIGKGSGSSYIYVSSLAFKMRTFSQVLKGTMLQFGENDVTKINKGINFEDSISEDFDCAHVIGKGTFIFFR